MADILTQLQDELDLLLNVMARSLANIKQNAPPSIPPGQQRLDSFAELEARNAAENAQSTANPSQLTQAPGPATPAAVSPDQFRKDIKEWAHDITIKEGQIEHLIAHLPGLDMSEEEQVQKMKELQKELEELEVERVQAVKEKGMLLRMVEDRIVGVGRMR
ncbi:CSE2-domain-containing protein [Clathrospora elynae]|uniref:Mediator of RNA polymerase II transcription subunit 21 n=1 Tax=Clathrospora elynae TaxID=706981 RepID=A0A6A5S6P6_9PLEO|nr:CSE2-domain-containing protein [Clathrospora elynae]